MIMNPSLKIRPIERQDQPWIVELLAEHWGSEIVVSRGKSLDASQLPGFIATESGRRWGLATYHITGTDCELVSLDSLKSGIGIGTSLINAVKQIAREAGCSRLWLITTNDNLHALGFYQKRGFHLAAIHTGATTRSRKIKPSIPLIGMNGIPIRDEIELEYRLEGS